MSGRPAAEGSVLIVDPVGGLSGDMFLGCLIALGVNRRAIERAVASLPGLEPFRIVAGRVKRRGITAVRARVECGSPRTSRDLKAILRMIEQSKLDGGVKERARETFSRLGAAEGQIHGVPPERVHFHEVGAVDSIVDIVGAVVALGMLGFPQVFHRTFRLGSGVLEISHGRIPVPAPATIELLRGRTVRLSEDGTEVVTPTGAALMSVLAEELPPAFSFRPMRIVYASGTRPPERNPGLCRVIEALPTLAGREVAVLRTTIDDMNPERYGHVTDLLFEAGALDVYLSQIIMKKGRPGVEVTVLCECAAAEWLTDILLTETTTLGVRVSYESRVELDRWTEQVDTALGSVEVKFGRFPDGSVKYAPEFESCRRVAAERHVPIARVYDAAREAAGGGGAPDVVTRGGDTRKGAKSRGNPKRA